MYTKKMYKHGYIHIHVYICLLESDLRAKVWHQPPDRTSAEPRNGARPRPSAASVHVPGATDDEAVGLQCGIPNWNQPEKASRSGSVA